MIIDVGPRIFSRFSELPRCHHHDKLNLNPPKTHLSGLALDGLTTLGDPGKDLLAILVEVELGDDDVGGGDGDGDGLAVGLLAGDTLDVDTVLETVDGGDTAGLSLVGAPSNDHLIVLADGDGADLIWTC